MNSMKTDTTHQDSFEAKDQILTFVFSFLRKLSDQTKDAKKNPRNKSKIGQLFMYTADEFKEIEGQLLQVTNAVNLILSEETSNLLDWMELIRQLSAFNELFVVKKNLFKTSISCLLTEVENYIDSIYDFVEDKQLDAVKNSWAYIEAFKNKSVQDRFKEDLELHDYTVDSDETMDFTNIKDYIIYSYDALGMWFSVAGISEALKNYIVKNDIYASYAEELIDNIPEEDFVEDFVIKELDIGLEAISDIYDPIKISTKYLETFEIQQSDIQEQIDKNKFIKKFEQIIINSGFTNFVVFKTERLSTSIKGTLLLTEEVTMECLEENLTILKTKGDNAYSIKYKDSESFFIMVSTFNGWNETDLFTLKELLKLDV